MQHFIVEVLPEEAGEPTTYQVWASTPDDAINLAFALDGGHGGAGKDWPMDEGDLESAKMYCRVLA